MNSPLTQLVSQQPICVTGASGFIASHLVKQLLSRGYQVRGTVRDAQNKEKYTHLWSLEGAEAKLELVSANLLNPAGFASALAGCEYIIHTASPYALNVQDPQKDLVDPAVNGTRNVFQAALGSKSIKRIVLTSSIAAITDEPDESKVLTEEDWNTKSSLCRNPYYYSKTLAEREAWQIVTEQKPSFDLVVINPFLVIGPSLNPGINTSNQLLIDILTGKYPGIMSLVWGFVDVRDVALAHILAMEKPEASGRYICANTTMTMREVVEFLQQEGYAEYKLPKLALDSPLGNFIVRLSSYLQPKGIGDYIRTHLGKTPNFNNGKIQEQLGLKFRPLAESLRDTIADLKRWKHI